METLNEEKGRHLEYAGAGTRPEKKNAATDGPLEGSGGSSAGRGGRKGTGSKPKKPGVPL